MKNLRPFLQQEVEENDNFITSFVSVVNVVDKQVRCDAIFFLFFFSLLVGGAVGVGVG